MLAFQLQSCPAAVFCAALPHWFCPAVASCSFLPQLLLKHEHMHVGLLCASLASCSSASTFLLKQHSLACLYQLLFLGLRVSYAAGDGRQHHPCNCNHQCYHCWVCCRGSYQAVDRHSRGLQGDTAPDAALVLHTASTAILDFTAASEYSVSHSTYCITTCCKHVHITVSCCSLVRIRGLASPQYHFRSCTVVQLCLGIKLPHPIDKRSH